MKKEELRPSSRQRYSQLQKEQSFLAEAFKVDNFYQNDKLNLHSLKHRLDEARGRVNQSYTLHDKEPASTIVPLSRKINERAITKYTKKEDQINGARAHNNTTLDHNYKLNSDFRTTSTKFRQTARGPIKQFQLKKTAKADMDISSIMTQRQRGVRGNQRSTNFALQMNRSSHQRHGSNNEKITEQTQDMPPARQQKAIQVPKIYSIGHRKNGFERSPKSIRSKLKIPNHSNHLQPLQKKYFAKIELSSIQNLRHFQMNIMTIWDLYEKLSTVSETVSNSQSEYELFSQSFINLLANYRQIVCSNKLEFIEDIVKNTLQNSQIKVILLSRVLENLSIVYVFLEIVEKTFIHTIQQKSKRKEGLDRSISFEASHLVNFVGLCSNNLLLLIRVFSLIHDVSDSLFLSQKTQKIFQTITQYEFKSFKTQLTSLKETLIRIEHNNQTISLIQSKLNNKMITSKQYHINCIGNFMRGVIIDCLKMTDAYAKYRPSSESLTAKPFYEYSFFIFEYLSYHLHHQNCIGLFPRQIETAPAPYFLLKKQFTVIINPINTLIHEKKGKIFIRAHTDHFLRQLDKKCDVIFWADQMPKDVDPLFNLITPNHTSLEKKQKDGHKFIPNFSEVQHFKRLYRHHCLYEKSNHGEMMMMKDISRIGCPDNKYFIIDANAHSYYSEDQIFLVELPWKGEAHDNKLLTTIDLLLPILRDGTDLNKGMRLMKPRLMEILNIKRKKKSKPHIPHPKPKVIEKQLHQELGHAQYLRDMHQLPHPHMKAIQVEEFNVDFQSKQINNPDEKDHTGTINQQNSDQRIIGHQEEEIQIGEKSKKFSEKQIFDRVLVQDGFIQ